MKVMTTDQHIVDWDRDAIVRTLLKETELCEEFMHTRAMPKPVAEEIAHITEMKLMSLCIDPIRTSLIRSMVAGIILSRAKGKASEMYLPWHSAVMPVGMSVYDAYKTDVGDGFEDKDNANLCDNPEKSHKKKADKMSKEQALSLVPWQLAAMHRSGDFHIHDLEYIGTRPFCADHDARFFFYYGLLPSGESTYSSVAAPAKRAEVAILHLVKAMGSAQTNFAGGQGYYNFLTFLAPYMRELDYDGIKQLMQMFVYEMMQMYCARGGQVVFSSVQLSPGVPKIWRGRPAVYAGHVYGAEDVYGDYEREVRLGFKALMEVMLEGDANGKPFSFPKPEISIEPCFMDPDDWTKAFDRENPALPTYKELYGLSYQLAAKFGTPYFDNQMPEYRGAGEGISCYQCCAYSFSSDKHSDPDFEAKMNFEDGKHFSMGSWMVMSLNCPRAAYVADHSDTALWGRLKELMDRCVDVFKHKQRLMRKVIDADRIPFATQRPVDPNDPNARAPPLVDLDRYVWTIGLIGVSDMVKHHTGYHVHESRDAKRFAIRTVIELQNYANELSKKHGMEIVLARTPAETTGQRFAVCDLLDERYRSHAIQVMNGDVEAAVRDISKTRDLPVYYTNGTHVPPSANISLVDRIDSEHPFFTFLGGGDILHLWFGEAHPDAEGIGDMIEHICRNTQTGYFAITLDFTVCHDCLKTVNGVHEECQSCGSTDVSYMSRITGYMQDVSSWNAGKKQEFLDRKRYFDDGTD